MSRDRIQYYAIVGVGRHPKEPSGMARRCYTAEGRVDESLRRDLTWHRDSVIVEWEYGSLVGELKEVDAGEAMELIERFRERWGRPGV